MPSLKSSGVLRQKQYGDKRPTGGQEMKRIGAVLLGLAVFASAAVAAPKKAKKAKKAKTINVYLVTMDSFSACELL